MPVIVDTTVRKLFRIAFLRQARNGAEGRIRKTMAQYSDSATGRSLWTFFRFLDTPNNQTI